MTIILFAWVNPLFQQVHIILESDATKSLESLALLESLYLMATAGASIKLPIISGIFQGASETMKDAIQYLSIANVAIALNLLILKITHAKVVLVGLSIIWLLSFRKNWSMVLVKILIIGLFLNPGLSLCTVSINYIDKEMKNDAQDKLRNQLQDIHKDYQQKEEKRKQEIESRKKAHFQEDKANGKDHLGPGQKIKDGVLGTISDAGLHVEEDFRLTKKAISVAAKKSLELVLNAFTTVLLMYFLLPVGYLWVGFRLFKSMFSPNLSASE